jgi:hypothetical protein
MYSMDSCRDCAYVKTQMAGREEEFQIVDIGADVKNLKAFLQVRDHSPVFDECKEKGYAGIPCFVREDGSVTLVPEEVGLHSRPVETTGQACRRDGSGC